MEPWPTPSLSPISRLLLAGGGAAGPLLCSGHLPRVHGRQGCGPHSGGAWPSLGSSSCTEATLSHGVCVCGGLWASLLFFLKIAEGRFQLPPAPVLLTRGAGVHLPAGCKVGASRRPPPQGVPGSRLRAPRWELPRSGGARCPCRAVGGWGPQRCGRVGPSCPRLCNRGCWGMQVPRYYPESLVLCPQAEPTVLGGRQGVGALLPSLRGSSRPSTLHIPHQGPSLPRASLPHTAVRGSEAWGRGRLQQ